MNRLNLLLATLALAALACSLGGSSAEPTEGAGGGVPIAKATLPGTAPATEAPPQATLPPEPTEAPSAVPEVAQAPSESQGPAVVDAAEGGIPVEVVDSNVRSGVLGPVLFGVFRNISEETLGTVALRVAFRDAAGAELGSRESYAMLTPIGPGELTPFEIEFPDGVPADVDSVGITVRWTPDYGTFPHTREGFELEGVEGAWGEFDYFNVTGTVHNKNSKDARFVDLGILAYNADGRLIGLYVGRVDDIQAGGSDFFKFGIVSSYFTEPEIANFEIIMVGSLAE